MKCLRENFNSFSVISDLLGVNLVLFARKSAVFWKKLHSWQKFYTTAGRDKFQVCSSYLNLVAEILASASLLILWNVSDVSCGQIVSFWSAQLKGTVYQFGFTVCRLYQVGRSCVKAQKAFAENFGLRRKF